MTEIEKEIWCNDCGVRMVRGGERVDIINDVLKRIAKCPKSRKREFVIDG